MTDATSYLSEQPDASTDSIASETQIAAASGAVEVPQPGAGERIDIDVAPGQALHFNFDPAGVPALVLADTGAVQFNFPDGGIVVIHGFQAWADAGGQATTGDGALADLSAAGVLPATAQDASSSDQQVCETLDIPSAGAGEKLTIAVQPGQALQLTCDLAGVQGQEVDGDLQLTFPNGGVTVIEGFDEWAAASGATLNDCNCNAQNLPEVLASLGVSPEDIQPAAGQPTGGPQGGSDLTGSGFTPHPGPEILTGLPYPHILPPTGLAYYVPFVEPTFFPFQDEAPDRVPNAEDDGPNTNNEEECVTEDTYGGEGNEFVPDSVSGNVLLNDTPGDGPITIDGIEYTGDYPGGATQGQVGDIVTIESNDGVWTLEFDLSDGDYTFTLNKPYDHVEEGQLEEALESFKYTISDEDGDKDSATLTICIEDDVPHAQNDEEQCAVEGTDSQYGGVLFGNVLNNDDQGADGAKVTSFTYDGGDKSADVPDGGSTTVQTALGGTLTVYSNGDWEYTPPESVDNSEGDVQDDFTYTITDNDGDTSSATQPICIQDGDNPDAKDDQPKVNNEVVCVIEDTDAEGAFAPASVSDNALANDVAGSDPLDSPPISDFTYTGNYPGGVNTSAVVANVVTINSKDGVWTMTLNVVSGDYTFTLNKPYAHTEAGQTVEATETFSYTLSDIDGDSDTATITICIEDDVPVAKDDVEQCVEEGAGSGEPISGNVLANDDQGADEHLGAGNQTKVTAISFDGGTTWITVPPAGLVDQATPEGGKLSIDQDGNWTYTPPDNVDNSNGDVQDGFLYEITDGDGDKSTAEQPICITDDSKPVCIDDSDGAVDEDSLPGANPDSPGPISVTKEFVDFGDDGVGSLTVDLTALANQGLKSKGETIEYVFDGTTLTAYIDTDNGNDLDALERQVFTVVFNTAVDPATYTFTLLDQIDHPEDGNTEGTIGINFVVNVTDGDGSEDSCPFTVTVKDDIPIQNNAVESKTVEEDDLNNAQSTGNDEDGSATKEVATGSVAGLVSVGADEPATFGLGTDFTSLTSQALKSGGIALAYAVSGDTLTAFADTDKDGKQDGGELTVFTLKVESDGDYTFTLVDQLDHVDDGKNDENTLSIDLSGVIKATDKDGDDLSLDSKSFTIVVQDDIPVQNANKESKTVEEDDLDNAQSKGNDEDGSVTKEVATGSVAGLVTVGADEPAAFSLGTDVSSLTKQGLTSGGTALAYAVNGDTLTAFADTDKDGSQDAGELTVFTLKVDGNGNYTFTLVDQLDHVDDGKNDENTLSIDLSGLIKATDKDGDELLLDSGSFTIVVQDDIPVQNATKESKTVEEDDLDNAQSKGNDEDGSVTKEVATGSVAGLVTVGADEPAAFSLGTDFTSLTSQALKSGGTALAYAVSGDTLTAFADTDKDGSQDAGELTVFTLKVDGNGNYTFTLVDQLDHVDDGKNDENTLSIDLSGVIKATDKDGDELLLDSGSFTIVVQDDIPVQNANKVSVTVEEDDMTNPPEASKGNNEDGSVDKNVASGTVANLATVGADEPAAFSVQASGLPALTSKGQTVNYTVVGNTLVAYTGADPNTNRVFTLQVLANGAYTFTLLDQIDHANIQGENNLVLDLSSAIVLTDFDGDSLALDAGSFQITVQDDIPVPFAPSTTYIENDKGKVTSDINFQEAVGTDETGDVVFTVKDGDKVTDSNGNPLEYFGEEIFYNVLNDHTVEGRTADDNLAFTITLDPTTDTYTWEQFGPLLNGEEFSFTDLSSVGGGNDSFKALGTNKGVPTDPPQDILISSNETVNTNSTEIGVGTGQNFGEGNTARFDMLLNLTLDAGDPTGFSSDGHFNITSWKQQVSRVEGGPGETTAFIVSILNSDDDSNYLGDLDDKVVTGFTVNVYDDKGKLQDTIVDGSKDDPDGLLNGEVYLTGIEENWDDEIVSTTAFDAVVVEGDLNATDDREMKLGIITIVTANDQDPYDILFPILGEDEDGDEQASTLVVNINPQDQTQQGGSGADSLTGDDLDNSLIGLDGSDTLTGGKGNDLLAGGNGIDSLLGGDGTDLLDGGAGTDTLTGGAGNDNFRLDGTTLNASDLITDYTAGDLIDLTELFTVDTASGKDINDYVDLQGTALKVDISGGGNFATTVATFSGALATVTVAFDTSTLSDQTAAVT